LLFYFVKPLSSVTGYYFMEQILQLIPTLFSLMVPSYRSKLMFFLLFCLCFRSLLAECGDSLKFLWFRNTVHSARRHKASEKHGKAFWRLTDSHCREQLSHISQKKKKLLSLPQYRSVEALYGYATCWLSKPRNPIIIPERSAVSEYYDLELKSVYLPPSCEQLTLAFLLSRWWHSTRIFVVQYFCNIRSIHFNYKTFSNFGYRTKEKSIISSWILRKRGTGNHQHTLNFQNSTKDVTFSKRTTECNKLGYVDPMAK
jgi:hypothetical protein